MDEIRLYNASELIDNQKGYSYDMNNQVIEEWPKNYVVKADDNADPY